MDSSVDLIIAGAGLSGLLSLLHVQRKHPEWKIVVLEREPRVGGRLRSTTEGSWSCGLQAMGAELYEYVAQSCAGPEGGELQVQPARRESLGLLSALKLIDMPFKQFSAVEMARALGGTAAVRDWAIVDELLGRPEAEWPSNDQAFSQVWKGDRKSAALVVLEHLAHVWGFPELWSAPARTIVARAQLFQKGQWTGAWDELFEHIAKPMGETTRLETNAQIMAARYEEKMWSLASTQGSFRAPRLLVAQSPWEAILWLPKDLWPNPLLNLTSKAKPVSLVVLSDLLLEPCAELPNLLLIPAEDVQLVSEGRQMAFQATLNYELTVQAPAVVKAVKRLKRAKKKLQSALPSLQVSDAADHIALLPVGWSQAAIPQEQRWFDKIAMESLQKQHLAFCGDAYGGERDSDRNLIVSVEALRKAWQL